MSLPSSVRPDRRKHTSTSFRRVLFVDDEAAIRAAFVRSVTPRGFLVDAAAGVQEALQLANRAPYPVIVTDLAMPDGDGLSLIRRLRRVQPRASFVILTGLTDATVPGDPEFQESVVSIVHKPWDVDELADTLHRSARLWQARSSHPPPPLSLDRNERVLLVEDSDADAELVEAFLAIHGPSYRIERAHGLTPALELLANEQYDAILADLALPDARGLDAVLRLQTVSNETPLVVMSGLDDEHVALEAVEAGAQDFLLKGNIDGPGLVRAVRYAQQRKRTEMALARLANFDTLTGLVNRSHFSDRLSHVLMRARRTGEHFAVFYLDLDGFKAINDTLGHSAGDALLVEVARRLEGTARESDVLARLGGDEFATIMDGLSQPEDAVRAADRILSTLAKPYLIEGREARVTVSIGIAFFPEGGESVSELLKSADCAMYNAKARGKNTYEVFHHEKDAVPESGVHLSVEIKHALGQGEFVLHYQPQYDVRSRRICAAEGLLRWRRGGNRLLPPDEFLPILEASSEILPTGAWAIRQACEDLQRWRERLPLTRISVNVSARQLDGDDLVNTVRAALSSFKIEPGSLELEVTESAVMKHAEAARQILYQLKELGVRIAMDDFGTGQSSLSHLYRLPFDTVKIDRSFVRDLQGNAKCQAVTRAIIALAKKLDLEIVAEGVETEAQRAFLTREGCDFLQGYLFGIPVSAEQFEHTAFSSLASSSRRMDSIPGLINRTPVPRRNLGS